MISVGDMKVYSPNLVVKKVAVFFLKAIITVECEGGMTGSGGLLGSQCRGSNLGSCGVHCWIGGCNSTNFAPILSKFRTGLLDLITKVVVMVSAIQGSGISSGWRRSRRGCAKGYRMEFGVNDSVSLRPRQNRRCRSITYLAMVLQA